MKALTLDGVETRTWIRRNRFTPAAAALANRHYSRERRGSPQVGGPGRIIVLVTPCERALWISKYHVPECSSPRSVGDGLDAWRCSMFRNEGAGLSSDLIREAMKVTATIWQERPVDGWVTWVDFTKTRKKRDPGRCFRKAGWYLDESWTHPRMVRLRAEIK